MQHQQTFGLTAPHVNFQKRKPPLASTLRNQSAQVTPAPVQYVAPPPPPPVQQQVNYTPPQTIHQENLRHDDEEYRHGHKDPDKLKRESANLRKKIRLEPDDPQIYFNYPLKPGLDFFFKLAEVPVPLAKVKVNIPETLLLNEQNNNVYIYTDKDGFLCKITDEINLAEIDKGILQNHLKMLQRLRMMDCYNEDRLDPQSETIDNFFFDQERQQQQQQFDNNSELQSDGDYKIVKSRKLNEFYTINEFIDQLTPKIGESDKNSDSNNLIPYMISRESGGEDWKSAQNVISYREYRDQKVSSGKLNQRFIYTRSAKASCLRLIYFTSNSKTSKANFAYRMTNRFQIFHQTQMKDRAVTQSEEDPLFEVQLVKGPGLKPFEEQAQNLVNLLERHFPIRINRIAVDFIQDIFGVPWVIGIREIRMEKAKPMSEIQGTGAGKKTLDQLTCSVQCKLCTIPFKKDDASKVLTYQLLWELVQHLQKRNVPVHKLKVNHSSTRPCRVCNLCYMLVVGEHELIEIEQEFARTQNVPISDIDIRVPIDTKPKHRPALLVNTLNQWRLLFNFVDITNIGSENNIDFDNLYFQYKLNNFQTCFKVYIEEQGVGNNTKLWKQNSDAHHRLKSAASAKSLKSLQGQTAVSSGNTSNQQEKEANYVHHNSVSIKQMRVHYFFNEEMDFNIEKFLNQSEIKCRLTIGTEWNSFIAEGTSKTLSHFKNRHSGGQRHSSQILLFFQSAKYCVLTINVGLVCDGGYDTSQMNLYQYNNIYFPEENFYNSDPFPPEWMQTFNPYYDNATLLQYTKRKREQPNEQEQNDYQDNKGAEKYTPQCEPRELAQMIDFTQKARRNSPEPESAYKNYFSNEKEYQQQLKESQIQYQLPNLGYNESIKYNFLSPDNNSIGGVTHSQLYMDGGMSSSQNQRADTAQIKPGQGVGFGRTQSQVALSQRPMTGIGSGLYSSGLGTVPGSTKNLRSAKHLGGTPSGQHEENQIKYQTQNSYLLMLGQHNQDKEETNNILQQYDTNFDQFGIIDDDDVLNDSIEEVIRDQLAGHFKKLNKIQDLDFSKPDINLPSTTNTHNAFGGGGTAKSQKNLHSGKDSNNHDSQFFDRNSNYDAEDSTHQVRVDQNQFKNFLHEKQKSVQSINAGPGQK